VKTLQLFTTVGCHLCEQAEALMAPRLQAQGFALVKIDIADSDPLVEKYGVRIPVIKRTDMVADLGWPFSEAQFMAYLAAPAQL
jgi:hypothetical protein